MVHFISSTPSKMKMFLVSKIGFRFLFYIFSRTKMTKRHSPSWYGCTVFFFEIKDSYRNAECKGSSRSRSCNASCNAMRMGKTSCSSACRCKAAARYFPSKCFGWSFLTWGGWLIKWLHETAASTTAGWESRHLTRTDLHLADSIFWMLVLISNLPTPLLICTDENFTPLTHEYPWCRVLEEQAAEKCEGRRVTVAVQKMSFLPWGSLLL